MSNLMLVIPEGWTLLDWDSLQNLDGSLNTQNVLGWLSTNSMLTLEEILKSIEVIPATSSLIEAKLIDDTYFIVLLG